MLFSKIDELTYLLFLRLENTNDNSNIYVNGVLNTENILATSLTLLFPDTTLKNEYVYVCRITNIARSGTVHTTLSRLGVNLACW